MVRKMRKKQKHAETKQHVTEKSVKNYFFLQIRTQKCLKTNENKTYLPKSQRYDKSNFTRKVYSDTGLPQERMSISKKHYVTYHLKELEEQAKPYLVSRMRENKEREKIN